ncbi:MAG: hypothetical protein J6Q75_05980 [Bacteroidaceae bacterium]|nr:hypothetical protein [Bacteroidaceae bacterium]
MTPSVYTVQLRQLVTGGYYTREEIESWFKDYELTDYLTQEEIDVINARGTWSKDKLAKKIVNHYWMREIGLETPALFEHHAKMLMDELMEEKLPLIYSASIKYDPLVNVDYTETFDAERENQGHATSNGTSTGNTSGLTVQSDTPQGQVTKANILAGNYASSTAASEAEDHSTTSGSSTTNDNGTESYTKKIKGNSGVSATAQRMVAQYRENIIAINRDIIEECSVLFMGVYNNKF